MMGNTTQKKSSATAPSGRSSGEGPPTGRLPPAPPGGETAAGVEEAAGARRNSGRRPSGGEKSSGRRGTGRVAAEEAIVVEAKEQAWAPPEALSSRDVSLLVALAHHGTGYAVLDPQKTGVPVVFASRGFCRAHGLAKTDVEGRPVHQVLQELQAGDDADRVAEALREALAADKSVALRTVRRPENAAVFSQWYLTGLKAADGRTVLVAAVERVLPSLEMCVEQPSRNFGFSYRKAQECMREGNDWSFFTPYTQLHPTDQALVDALQERHEMFCITDPNIFDNPIVFVSDNFVAETGHPREEINGINCRFLQGPNTNQEDVDKIRRAIKERRNMRVCLVNYRKNGTTFINQFNLSMLKDVEGRLAYFIGVQIDVEDVEVLPFPNTRQTMQEMLLESELFLEENAPQGPGSPMDVAAA